MSEEGITDAMIGNLRRLMKKASARPWVAFDEGKTLAIMKGKCPPLNGDGYPTKRWPEIVAWTGFDAADVPWGYRRANLHLIVSAVNALPSLLAEIERLQSSLPPVKGTIVERVARAIYAAHPVIEFYERGPTDPPGNRWLSWDHIPQGHRDRMGECATAAIESMPIQRMVDGLEAALGMVVELDETGTYSVSEYNELRSLLASVRSDGDGV